MIATALSEVIRKRNETIRKLREKCRAQAVLIAEIELALEGTAYDGIVAFVRQEMEEPPR